MNLDNQLSPIITSDVELPLEIHSGKHVLFSLMDWNYFVQWHDVITIPPVLAGYIKYLGIYIHRDVDKAEFDKYIQLSGWNWCHVYNYMLEELIKDDALTEVAWKEISQKMYDDVLSSQYGIDSKNCFSISPESIQLKPELKTKMKIEQVVLDDLEAMVDMHTESHRL